MAKERTTIMIDRELLAEAQDTAARIGIPLVVAGSTSKFLRYLLQDFNAKNPKHPKKPGMAPKSAIFDKEVK